MYSPDLFSAYFKLYNRIRFSVCVNADLPLLNQAVTAYNDEKL